MNFEQTIKTLMYSPVKQSWLIRGRHGLGKSQGVAQTAARLSVLHKVPYGFVDIRLGQYEVGDLIGIQRPRDKFTITNNVFVEGNLSTQEVVAENVSVHDLPLWFPRGNESKGILFFDEINRGTRDTQNWAMQIVLDRKSNFIEVPKGWRVVGACNDDLDLYAVHAFDPALLSRFGVIDFNPTHKEWFEYAEKTGVHYAVLRYLTKFSSELDPPTVLESNVRYPDRRSWVMLSDTIKHMANEGNDPLKDFSFLPLLAMSFVGKSVAINFSEFIQKDFKVFTPLDILDGFSKIKSDFEKMIATDFTFYNSEVSKFIGKENLKLTEKQMTNLRAYVDILPNEIKAGFWVSFNKHATAQSVLWYKKHGTVIQECLSKSV